MIIHFDVSEQANIDENVITCPNCEARYTVAAGMLGEKGREVKCAKCHKSWKAMIEAPVAQTGEGEEAASSTSVQAEAEAALDVDFEAVANEADAANSPDEIDPQKTETDSDNSDANNPNKTQTPIEQREDIARRKDLLARTMPKGRWSKLLQNLGIALLAIVSLSGLFMRENIVRTFPDLAGLYGAVGLGVNVVGLEFSDVKTIRMLREGEEVMDISASIASVSSRQVSVPRIIVTLLDENGLSVFEWSVTSRAAIMLPGEWIEFETKLTSPPGEARSVRLAFERAN